jgi:hypothetical protein
MIGWSWSIYDDADILFLPFSVSVSPVTFIVKTAEELITPHQSFISHSWFLIMFCVLEHVFRRCSWLC